MEALSSSFIEGRAARPPKPALTARLFGRLPGRPQRSWLPPMELQDRLDFERRRLPVRLALLISPLLVVAGYGRSGMLTAVLLIIPLLGSSIFIFELLRHAPDRLRRIHLGLRLVDVGLIYAALYIVNKLVGDADFDSIYILPVIAATATHGVRGTLLISLGGMAASLLGRWQLGLNGT